MTLAPRNGPAIRAMIVDDSPVTRRLIELVVTKTHGVDLVAELGNGERALEVALKERVDVLILDVNMPESNGRDVLVKLRDSGAELGVVVYSGAETGVIDELKRVVGSQILCHMMPKGAGAGGGIDDIKDVLLPAVLELGDRVRARRRKGGAKSNPVEHQPKSITPSPSEGAGAKAALAIFGSGAQPGASGAVNQPDATAPTLPKPAPAARSESSKNASREAPQAPLPQVTASSGGSNPASGAKRFGAVVIGSSTGGPEALRKVLQSLPANLPVPVAIVQHMPIGFTAQLASRLNSQCDITVREATDGERMQAGVVLIAPGGKHLELHADGPHLRARLTESEPENSCRPAVDVLFRTAAAAVPNRLLAVVLTGMGYDGKAGAEDIHRVKGWVLVQNEETSVVWGMPGAIAKAGEADEVAALDEIGPRIVELLAVGRASGRAI